MTAEASSPRKDLASSAARGAGATLAGQSLKFILQFGGIIFLARLLEPSDFGLVAMVVAIVGVGEVLRDFGLSAAAIQAKTISQQQKSNLFWINTGIGLLLAVACVLSAPLVSSLFQDARVESIAYALSVTFLLSGMTTQLRAGLARNMKFARLVLVEICAQAIALSLAVICAYLGIGFWALVVQQTSQSMLTFVGCAAMAKWLPSLPRKTDGMRQLASFGWNLMGAQLLQYAGKNLDSVLIGRQFGATDLGYYNRASQLVTSPLNQINVPASSVAIPVLSRLSDDKPRYDRYIIRGQLCLMTMVVSVFSFVAVHSVAVVELLLGDDWLRSTPFLAVLAVGAIFQAASYATYWAFVTKGHTKSLLKYAAATRALVVVTLICGLPWGAMGVAIAYSLGLALVWPIGILWIHKVSNAPAKKMLTNGCGIMLTYSLASVSGWGVVQGLQLSGIKSIAVGFVVSFALLLLVAILSSRYRRELRDISAVVAIAVRKAKP